ncbi:AAA family ATPase [Numidum massiliense]|uniref:AAA family ATPase n=1 Tax=Numidum massiliense TaxID=1522315 RepID=UPI0006D5442B|nr:AAA family ATPase [Numidum massiliense]
MSEHVITREQHRIHVVLHQGKDAAATRDGAIALPFEREQKMLQEDRTLQNCLEELNCLVGLKKIKRFVYEIYALIKIGQKRQLAGLSAEQQVLHMVFKGNPGTGKTTVARVLGRLFRDMGVLSQGHLIEVERADLVGEYIGHTAQRTREWVKKALGGILFIDEAYSLARGGEKDFGKEAVDTLVKAMEDEKDKFILILAGYPLEMEQFLLSNPGLPSRFPVQITFPDYALDELMCIADAMLEERQYRMTPQAKQQLRKYLQLASAHALHNFGNAREVRNQIEKAIRRHAFRLMQTDVPTREQLMQIEANDLR